MFKKTTIKSKSAVGAMVVAIGGMFSNGATAQTTDLIFSEYVEGSGNNKYLEVFNGTGATVDLSNYEIRLYSNGASSPSTTSPLSGMLSDSSTIVYSKSTAVVYAGATTDLAAINFNGDDAVELFNVVTNASVDIFGVIGCDPGSEWVFATNRTKDRTLRRNSNVLSGVSSNPSCSSSQTDFTTLQSEWTVYSQDDVSDLGMFGSSGGNNGGGDTIVVVPGCAQDLFFSEYIEGSSLNKCLEISNKTGAPIDLGAGGYQIQMFFNGSSSAGTTISLTGTIADNDVYVVCDDGAAAAFIAQADLTPNSSFFNGDDAVALVKTGVILDIIGEIGADPGTAWTNTGVSTLNTTLVRKDFVTQGITTNPAGLGFPTLSSEWLAFATDMSDSLGAHTVISCGDSVLPPVVDLGADVVICEGPGYVLDAGTTGSSYLWSNGATTQSITVSESGVYSVVVTNPGGSATDAIAVNVVPTPQLLLFGDSTLCAETTGTLRAALLLEELIISEYVEGSGQNKCIEIFNGTGADIDLSTYAIQVSYDGGASADTLALSGTIYNDDVYVLCNDGADVAFLDAATSTTTNTLWDGNDAIVLTNGGVAVDIFGVVGDNPGTEWTSASNQTSNRTLVRKSGIISGISANPTGTGVSAFYTLEDQWTESPEDDASTLGFHEIIADYAWSTGDTTQLLIFTPSSTSTYSLDVTYGAGCVISTSITVSVDPPAIQVSADTTIVHGDTIIICGQVLAEDLFISQYVEGSGLNKCIEIYNGTGSSIDLAADMYTLDISFNGGTASTSIPLTGTIANGATHVICDDEATAPFLALADETTTMSLWNGNDAIVLSKAGAPLDIFGVIGDNPGAAWLSDTTATANYTLRRNENVISGVTANPTGTGPTAFTTLGTEWTVYPNNDETGLGSHSINPGGSILWSTGDTTNCIEVSPNETTVYTFTYTSANGCDISQDVTVTVDGESRAMALVNSNGEMVTGKVSLFPNPTSDRATIELMLEESTSVNVAIMNAQGQEMMQIFNGSVEANETNMISFDASVLSAGVYFCHINTAAGQQIIRLVVTK